MCSIIASIEAFVKREMTGVASHDLVIGHGYLHVDRVRRHALQIGDDDGFNRLDLVETAALNMLLRLNPRHAQGPVALVLGVVCGRITINKPL